MAQINIRMDDQLKKRAEALFEDLGMSMSTAINIFIRQSVREHGIPFEVKADPFYGEENQAELRRRVTEIESGKVKAITKTMEELEAMEHE